MGGDLYAKNTLQIWRILYTYFAYLCKNRCVKKKMLKYVPNNLPMTRVSFYRELNIWRTRPTGNRFESTLSCLNTKSEEIGLYSFKEKIPTYLQKSS